MKSYTPPDSWLGIQKIYGNGTTLKTESDYNSREPQSNVALFFSPSYAMGCCGAATISNLSGSVQPKDRENLAYSIYRMMGGVTYYGIASSSQLEAAKVANSLLGLLMELGLKEVYNSPNRNHGPNNMHLMVWDPVDSMQSFEKYVWFNSPAACLPISMKNLSEEKLNKLFEKWYQLGEKEKIEADKKAKAEKDQKQWAQITALDSMMRIRHLLNDTYQTYLQDTLKRHGYEQRTHLSSNDSSRSSSDPIGQAQSFSQFANNFNVHSGNLGKY